MVSPSLCARQYKRQIHPPFPPSSSDFGRAVAPLSSVSSECGLLEFLLFPND